jgi:HlyD family secretion protein
MKRLGWLLGFAGLVVAGVAVWTSMKEDPPHVDFVKATRMSVDSALSTNGRTEPAHWAPVHAGLEGRVEAVLVKEGQAVGSGQELARLHLPSAEADLAAAKARLAQARAVSAELERGGPAAELAGIDASLVKLAAELEAAAREVEVLERLVARDAATRAELTAARNLAARLKAEITGLKTKRSSLVRQSDLESAQARVREAEASVAAVEAKIAACSIRSPMRGVVFELKTREGDWATPDAALAKVGGTERLRVILYVDEPELGRVRQGQEVQVTWDSNPAGKWRGIVEQMPSQIVALGSRQVGEVPTLIENPGNDLPVGANINADIRTQSVAGAITIPKEALRKEGDHYGVYVLQGKKLEWRVVEAGVSSVTRLEVRSGLREGETVAVAGDTALSNGMEITPRVR